MKKIQTLNEEIKRIKSLFGEERLYGNLVTENKILLKEQNYKSLKKIWDDVAEAVLKGTRREVTFGRGLGSVGAPKLSIKKLKSGEIKWYKGGVEIEPNIKNLMTNTTNRKIRKKINALVDENDLDNFFANSEEGLYSIYDDILNDLKLQKVIDPNKADELLASFKSANVSKKMQNKFFGKEKDEFFTGVLSIKDLKDVHPGVGELMDDIPGLEKKIEKILKQSKDHEIYDSEIVELARFFQGKGGIKNDGGQVAYYLDEANGEIRFVVDKGHPLSTNTGNIKKTYKTNLEDPNKINVTVDLKNISQKDLNLLKKNLPDATGTIDDIPTKSVFKTQDNLMDYDDLADIQKQIDDIADDIIKRGKDGDITTTKVGKIKNKIEDIIISTLNNEKFPLVDYFKELFSKKFRKDFNVKSWKSEGAGINPILDRVLTDKEKGYLDSFYTVKNAGDNRTPFIDSKLDPDLIKKGYTEGMIHPNAVLRDDYLDLMYARVKVPLVKVRKAFYSKQPDYRSTMKTVGRLIKNTAFFIPLGPYESIFMQVWGGITQTVLRICFTGTINKILAGDMLIDTAYAMYRYNCYDEVVNNIRSFSGLSNEAKDGLLGKNVEVTNNDGSTTPVTSASASLKPILDLVGQLTYDLSGTPPKYAPVDSTNIDDSWLTIIDVFSKDKRKITNEQYKINTLNPKNVGGDGWELTLYNNNNALKVYVDKDGNLCSKANYLDKTKCTTYHFSLTCGSFNTYYQEWKDSVDIKKIIEEMGMSVLWSIFVEQKNMQDLIIDKSREITNDIYKDTVESLDVDGDGKFNVVKDGNKAIDNTKRSSERFLGNGSGGSKTNDEYIKGGR